MTDTLTVTPDHPPAPPAPTGGSRGAIRAVLVLVAALACLGAVGVLGAAAAGIGSSRAAADDVDLPAGLRALTVNVGDLPISLQVTADPQATAPRAEVRYVTALGAGRPALRLSDDGATLSLSGERDGWLRWARAGELTLVLPPETARAMTLTIGQRFGALQVDADLDRLNARNDNGAVLLRGSANAMDIRNQHGVVHSRGPISVRDSFTANSAEGEIEVDFRGTPPRRVDVSTGAGEVQIGLPGDGPFAVTAASDRGSTEIRVPQAFDPGAARANVTARSGSGDVTVQSRP
ncbi:hypothetical protein [Mycolicibacterium brumae]|uniref:Adhesin domain-containing protein n=1 Tax=Mycolicibacterium brumae TaxID=85968 RepID=A0A2G5PAJ3_9MYCO|nr:hypothetical protein [Mycolicibacterium brumae]MCV7193077.1 hypothetical protein [Mycolicibacterium brumae]PIB75389.1 hypothetical protein CQY22_009630 [Mycolicibacterium brumae]RWA21999.1 hypothetical protein MBRU_13515 [Mycolicibacterium brumae DSM 44177]UWW07921.1 DUF4097 domain-containing protein [Mycolicibacterium brumae]